MIDRHYRSVMKAVSWRMVGTFDTVIVSYFISGELMIAVSIGFVELFTKMFLYYLHERAWNRVTLGRTDAGEDYQI